MEQVAICPKCGGNKTIINKDGKKEKCTKCGGSGEIRLRLGPSIASNTSKKPVVRKITQLNPLGDYPDDKRDYYKPPKMFKEIEKANLPPDAEKLLKEEILRNEMRTSVENMAKNPSKKLGIITGGFGKIAGAASGGKDKAFDALKQKWGEKKPGISNKLGSLFKKKEEVKDYVENKGQTYTKTKDSDFETCKKCGTQWNKTHYSKCPECSKKSFFSSLKGNKKETPTKQEKGEESKEESEENPGKITKGKVGLILASIGGMIAGYFPFVQYFPELANSFLVVGGTSIAMITLSMFLKPKQQGAVIPIWLVASLGGLYATGSLGPVIPAVNAFADDLTDIGKNIGTGWSGLMCFMKTSDPNCWEPEPTAEENVNKIGDYQTLQMSEGRRTSTGTLDNPKPVGRERYSYEVTLKNMNDNIYEINITEIKAWANETLAYHVYSGLSNNNPYVLKPKEEFPVRFMWGYTPSGDGSERLPECPNGIINFKINVSSRQYGGGFSNYGIAPSDEGDYIKFLHYFDPEITAEPGPLNIYVYSDPYAIDWSYFNNNRIPFYIIIKIANPKVQDSVATLNEIHLVQTFEAAGSQKFFSISTCQDDLGNPPYTPINESCPSGKPGNCYKFTLNNLTVNYDESREIVCTTNINSNQRPGNDITDQIRVYTPYYDFKQKFVYSRSCKIETTVSTIGSTAPVTVSTIEIEPSPHL